MNGMEDDMLWCDTEPEVEGHEDFENGDERYND